MGSLPPLGYDDSTFIPKIRLQKVVAKISKSLDTIQKVSKEHIPKQLSDELAHDFEALAETTDELEMTHFEVVKRVLQEYTRFSAEPTNRLDSLRGEVENLKLFISHG